MPASDRLTLQFVFASEEYNEFANAGFNDVFGLFIGGTNRALLPDGVTVVSIDNVNGGNPLGVGPRNPEFYVNNDCSDGPCPLDMQADGKTVVLSFNAPVAAGAVNHVKLAIADAANPGLDSWIFLKEASFRASEVCDNGVDDDGDTLVDLDDPDCHRCGDEILDPGEDCDDGNLVGGDGCSTSCRFESCGNEVVDSGEECDDGNTVSGDACESNCTLPACGNEIVDSGEECDDGNTLDGDCCSATCGFEALGSACDADHDFCTIDQCDGLAHCELATLQPGCEPGEGPFGDPTCSDTQDNDGDDLIDIQDPGCAAPVEGPPGAPSCSDGLENDGDGFVDAADPGCEHFPLTEECNGVDDDGDNQIDEGFSDSDADGLADCVDLDQDNDGVRDGADNCPGTANPTQQDTDGDGFGDACDEDVPSILNPPSGLGIVVDGQFGPPGGEWNDVTAASFLAGDSKVYMALDPATDAIHALFDFRLSTVPLLLGQEAGHVSFQVGGGSVFDVFFVQGGANTNAGPNPGTSAGGDGDQVRVLLNGQPFDNSAGCIAGAVDYNTTSPNFPGQPHNLFELRVRRTGFSGGCYSPEPAVWSAALPAVTFQPPQVGAGDVFIAGGGGGFTVYTPLVGTVGVGVLPPGTFPNTPYTFVLVTNLTFGAISPTTSTSTTTTSTTTTSTTTTSTTTTSTTTTTLTTPPCSDEATFPSIDCRLHALLDAIDAANELGSNRAALRMLVGRAIENLDKAQLRAIQGDSRRASVRLRWTGRSLKSFNQRLNSKRSRLTIPEASRRTFSDAAQAILDDVDALRATF